MTWGQWGKFNVPPFSLSWQDLDCHVRSIAELTSWSLVRPALGHPTFGYRTLNILSYLGELDQYSQCDRMWVYWQWNTSYCWTFSLSICRVSEKKVIYGFNVSLRLGQNSPSLSLCVTTMIQHVWGHFSGDGFYLLYRKVNFVGNVKIWSTNWTNLKLPINKL